MTRHKKLDAATLRSVAKELRQSANNTWRTAKRNSRLECFSAAAEYSIRSDEINMWAEHFDGQALLAEGGK